MGFTGNAAAQRSSGISPLADKTIGRDATEGRWPGRGTGVTAGASGNTLASIWLTGRVAVSGGGFPATSSATGAAERGSNGVSPENSPDPDMNSFVWFLSKLSLLHPRILPHVQWKSAVIR